MSQEKTLKKKGIKILKMYCVFVLLQSFFVLDGKLFKKSYYMDGTVSVKFYLIF